ncbi:MAG TPA: hypothetical protein VFH95_08850 [Candidatus Kapabacteria bacterium]|nr:hypothetical protein [Candidatus Kapabacteria bacterium]
MSKHLISLAIFALAFASCRNNSTGPTNTNSGDWTVSSSGTSSSLVVGEFINSTTGFVSGTNGTFLATTDAGNTWSMRSPAPVFSGSVTGTIYGISFLDATTGFAAGDQRDISKTIDGGMTWQPMDASNVPQSDLIRSIYFTNRTTGFVGTSDAYGNASGSICQTKDGGQTWNPILTTNGGIYNINFIPGTNGQDGVALGRFGVAYWTNDGGTTWTAGTSDQPNALIVRSTFLSAAQGYAVAQDISGSAHGYILRTIDAGRTWSTVYTSSPALDGIDNDGNQTITAAGYSGLVVESTDAGGTWNSTTAGSGRWIDVRYATQHRAVLFGDNGAIDVRDK